MKNNKQQNGTSQLHKILIVVLVVVISTIIIGIVVSLIPFKGIGGDADSWLGYFGGVIGIVGAYLIFNLQQNEDKKQFKEQSIDQTFFTLLHIFNDLVKDKKDELEELYKRLVTEKETVDIEILHRSQNMIISNSQQEIQQELRKIDFITEYGIKYDLSPLHDFNDNNTLEYFRSWIFDDLYFPNKHLSIINYFNSQVIYWDQLLSNRRSINDDLTLRNGWSRSLNVPKDRLDRDIQTLNKLFNEESLAGKRQDVLLKDLDACRKQFLNEMDQTKNKIRGNTSINIDENYTFEDKKKLINDTFSPSHVDTGNFFRYFYRILKYLYDNINHIEKDQLRQYLGILRAILDEKMLILIAYNAIYMDQGNKLKQLLSKSTFYDSKTIISVETLLWGKLDVIDFREKITNNESTDDKIYSKKVSLVSLLK